MQREKEIPVTDLQLDPANYRTGKQSDQRQAISALIEEQKIKLVHLAEDIIANGLSPIESIMVVPVPGEKHRYTVIEGNRRIAAIKLLFQPDLAEGTTWHNAFKRLHKQMPGQVPKKIICRIGQSKEETFLWIERRHDTGLKGAGLEPWSTIALYRAHAAQGKSTPAIDVLEFVLAHGQLDSDVEERVRSQDFPITNLERLLRSAYVGKQLELDRGERYLTSTANKKWVLAILREFVTTVAREEYRGKKFSVHEIYTAAQQKQFFSSLLSKQPKPRKSARRWAISAETALPAYERSRISQRQRKLQRQTAERTKLIPKGCNVHPPSGRANDIYHELRRLPVEDYRNAVAILLRVFLEFSVEEYIGRRAVPGVTSDDKLSRKLQVVAQHMETNGIMDRKALYGVRKAASDPNSLFSTVTLNAYVHNVNFYPSAGELKTSWDNLEPFIERLWHG